MENLNDPHGDRLPGLVLKIFVSQMQFTQFLSAMFRTVCWCFYFSIYNAGTLQYYRNVDRGGRNGIFTLSSFYYTRINVRNQGNFEKIRLFYLA